MWTARKHGLAKRDNDSAMNMMITMIMVINLDMVIKLSLMDFNVINMALWLYQWFCFCPQKCQQHVSTDIHNLHEVSGKMTKLLHIHNSWVLNIQIANISYMHSTSIQGVKLVVKCWHRVTRDQLPANSCQTTCLRQVTYYIWVIFLHNMHDAFLWKLSWNRPFRLKSSILTFLSPARGKYEQER